MTKLYLMRADDKTKIGISVAPERRLKQISTQHQHRTPISLLGVYNLNDAERLERRLHRLYENERVWDGTLPTDEWFFLSRNDLFLLTWGLTKLSYEQHQTQKT